MGGRGVITHVELVRCDGYARSEHVDRIGVSLANMVIGGAIVAHTRRVAFEQALAVQLKRG